MAKFDLNIIESTNKKNAPKKDSKWWSPQSGENTIRLIENPDTDNPPMFIAYKHFNVGPDNRSYWCRKTDPSGNGQRNWDEACPICEKVSKLYDSGNEDDKALGARSKATQRILLNVVDLSKPDEGVKVFECAQTLWKMMHKYWTSKKYGNLADADEGYNFIIDKQGPPRQPKYDESHAADEATPIANKDWPTQMHNLTEVVPIKSYDALKSIMETGVDTDQENSKASTATGSSPIVEADIPTFAKEKGKETEADDGPPFDVEDKTKPKAEKKKARTKKPPCFGEFDEDEDDCAECKWEGVCIDASEDDTSADDTALEADIMAEMDKG